MVDGSRSGAGRGTLTRRNCQVSSAPAEMTAASIAAATMASAQ
jgi:hypothetical protein